MKLTKFLYHFLYKDFQFIGKRNTFRTELSEPFYRRKLESFNDTEYDEVKLCRRC